MKPNILLITADQFRWDCMGCAGNPVIRTPHLDGLARRGMRFSNAFTPDPICIPARATIMTGNYPHVCTGYKTNKGRIRDGQPLMTEVLKTAGYRAYACGKLHFAPYAPPGSPRLVHGFEHVDLTESGRILETFDPQGHQRGLEDYFDYLSDVGWHGFSRAHGSGNNDSRPCPSPLPAEHYVDHWIADCTMRRVDRHQHESADRPFFLWMSSPKPHSPLDPPRPYDEMYDPRKMPPPFGGPELLADRDPALERERFIRAANSLSPQAWLVLRSYYYGSVSFLDGMIGRVLDHLAARGLLDNTLVIFSADHGDLLGDFGTQFKVNHLNGSVRVPFLVAGPGVAHGAASAALVGLQDILPTCAAAGGAAVGQTVQGLDLAPVLRDPAAAVRDVFYAATETPCGQSSMVTDGRWKYVYCEGNATEELYDQVNDLAELHNLAHDAGHAALLGTMRARLRDAAENLGDERLLTPSGFVSRSVDRAAFAKLPVTGMGWRWY